MKVDGRQLSVSVSIEMKLMNEMNVRTFIVAIVFLLSSTVMNDQCDVTYTFVV